LFVGFNCLWSYPDFIIRFQELVSLFNIIISLRRVGRGFINLEGRIFLFRQALE